MKLSLYEAACMESRNRSIQAELRRRRRDLESTVAALESATEPDYATRLMSHTVESMQDIARIGSRLESVDGVQ